MRPVQVARPLLQVGGSTIRATRADVGGGFPLVIAPRKTNLLAERPLIRWTAPPSATSFKVTVRGSGVNWTTDVAGKTEIPYPADARR